jgi:plastocyanin
MKKVYLFLATLMFLNYAFATTHEVLVEDFQFTPANLNVNVGDTIKWTWVSGDHTTTSTTIPSGATSWNAPMTSDNTTFLYKITEAGTYNYKCIPHASFGMVGTITASIVLPVVIKDFGIFSAKNNSAQISWSTATEINSDHFEIMRSANGVKFDQIASVPAKGTSSALVDYSYTDNSLPSNTKFIYYYLSVVDKDGTKALSEIKIFRNENGTAKLIASLSPNPINRPGHLMLQFNSEKVNTMHVQLFDASGKLVKQADMSAVAGLNNGHFHIGDVAPGTYTIVFMLDKVKESYKVVVQ